MALVDLTKVQPDHNRPCCEPDIYGLCISLNDEQAKALGITSAPEVGTPVGINAAAVVRRVSTEIDHAGAERKEIYLQLQITHMELVAPPKSSDAATALYGE
ncbi:hypothetical protein BSL82_10135 [Tardibacter chloracetimidivorans]|uniref:Uncharacterized protein n=1 Tax=Tardibacter chloracetimidivorans TaxID=1921510 RepID=A0A1L3ZVH0_9SPHN|nr:hypothetical protein [Tardibacter chloracetimidivorans]API59631.1 hypothetical protein BSL82_10135 [Tardibacter chloracetimidivorans]